MAKTRRLPETAGLGSMQDLISVRLGFAGTAYLNRFAEALAPTGLTPGRLLAVAYVHANPGCEQNALARGLSINKASAMTLVDRLETQGVVERRPGVDRRSNALHLTERGEQVFAQALVVEHSVHEELFGWMKPDQLAELGAAIDEITRRASSALTDDDDDIRQSA